MPDEGIRRIRLEVEVVLTVLAVTDRRKEWKMEEMPQGRLVKEHLRKMCVEDGQGDDQSRLLHFILI